MTPQYFKTRIRHVPELLQRTSLQRNLSQSLDGHCRLRATVVVGRQMTRSTVSYDRHRPSDNRARRQNQYSVVISATMIWPRACSSTVCGGGEEVSVCVWFGHRPLNNDLMVQLKRCYFMLTYAASRHQILRVSWTTRSTNSFHKLALRKL